MLVLGEVVFFFYPLWTKNLTNNPPRDSVERTHEAAKTVVQDSSFVVHQAVNLKQESKLKGFC